MGWSDESCFIFHHVDGQVCALPGVGCWETLGPAIHVDVTLTHSFYQCIVDHAHAFAFPGGCGVFQWDNACCNKKNMVPECFEEEKYAFQVLTCPPYSTDFSPNRHLWNALDEQVQSMDAPPPNLQDSKNLLLTCW